ncbi:MAG: mechanosensitive ion channel family protein [candidate division NC10 bacterium]|nr:mechanosensitive ion channel family protein [candidate division NC10 bacterium]
MMGISLENLTPGLFRVAALVIQAVLRIGLVVVAGYVGARFLRVALDRLESVLITEGERTEMVPGTTRQRVATLIGLIRTITLVVLWALVAIVSLDQIGLNVTPILAGAGIIGLAVGFGAQNLVRDVISGFFMVLEDQVRVGDVAIVNGTGGLVEAITFRTTILRDLSGVVHVFENGTINTLANMTKEWSGYLMDIGVAYKEDTDRVITVMRRVAEELRQDPVLGPMILEPIEIFGVDNFADSAVIIKARLKTRPIRQWDVGREYRRRLKKAFDAEGIEIPFPQRSILVGEASKPLPVVLAQAAAGSGRAD